jgi:aspartate 1-decarboxylase
MRISVLKSKLHGGRITSCKPDYEGSIAVDSALLKKARIRKYEKVLVVDMDSGSRFETYVMPGKKGEISVNGGAARLCKAGHRVCIFSFASVGPREKAEPVVIILDGKNKPK